MSSNLHGIVTMRMRKTFVILVAKQPQNLCTVTPIHTVQDSQTLISDTKSLNLSLL